MKIVLIAAVVLVAGCWVYVRVSEKNFYRSFVNRAAYVKARTGVQPEDPVTEKDLKGLPEPVARYLRFSKVLGRKRMSSLRIIHSGSFKTSATRPFAPITGEYFITTRRPSFCWYGTMSMGGLPVAAFDSYFNGKGRMLVKILSAVTVVDARSQETDNSAFGRCVAEMSMAPTFFLDRDLVRWEATGKDSAKCTVTDAGFSTEAELFVNPDGSLAKIMVMRYFDRGRTGATLEKFTGTSSGYKEQAGFMLPTKLDGTWNLKEGDLHYVSFTIDRYEIE